MKKRRTNQYNRDFRSFNKARKFVRSLGFKKVDQWNEYRKSGKKPIDIPSNPPEAYANEWTHWKDFLGTGKIGKVSKKYRTYKEARKFARSLKLKSWTEWNNFSTSGKKPGDIPTNPAFVYKNKGWINMGDFLGTGNVHTKNFRSFEESREFARSLKLKSRSDWNKLTSTRKFPKDVPVSPEQIYKKEWTNWGDYLGTGRTANKNRKFRPFKEARKFVRSLKLKSSSKEWIKYCKSGERPSNIPSNPQSTYLNKGWKGWGDFIGTGNRRVSTSNQASFATARKFARSLKLKSSQEWHKYCKSTEIPDDIPSDFGTYRAYKSKGWQGWDDFLGVKKIRKWTESNTRPFEEAREFVHSLKLKNLADWKKYAASAKKPDDIPAAPPQIYKEWKSLGDWLGTGFVANRDREYRSYNESRKFARKLGLKSRTEWEEYCKSGKLPKDVPSDIFHTYPKEFTSMGDFLGTGAVAHQVTSANYLPARKGVELIKKLAKKHNLKNSRDWRRFAKKNKKMLEKLKLPAQPMRVYSLERVWRKMK